ncbi:G-type lectin S-receptor-like serine/threonine-protein kinase SD1-1 [Ancistrocladus abbreviatus]
MGHDKDRCMVETKKEESELPFFDYSMIAQATNDFSDENKLGEGGFGPVYKGILKEGKEIAVKRLSKDSAQGLDAFKSEVMLIAKLQHRNLVKLLGCCIQDEERILIYEYLPNKSLDYFIFDQTGSRSLEWAKRFEIINGIARGLLYLHQDSRLRIVHRDLKAGNILLDHELNPKISDFGMARSFDGNECQEKTKRVVGTYGYMSPEYAIDGLFSSKSDVFSFGVLVLEIVSGKRNRGFNHSDHHHNLLGHAWILYMEGECLELVDPSIDLSNNASQLRRCIHVGLLCVQQSPEDRPSMSSVVVMLSSEIELPRPKQPGFFIARDLREVDSFSSKPESCSTNEMTMTLLSGR